MEIRPLLSVYYCIRLHLFCQRPIAALPWGHLKFLIILNNELISVNGAVDLTHTPPCLKSLCWGSQSESGVLSTMSPGPSPSPLWLYSLTSTSPHTDTHIYAGAVSSSREDAALETFTHCWTMKTLGECVLFATIREWIHVFVCVFMFSPLPLTLSACG